MLRLLVVALFIANLLFWAWHQPALTDAVGWAPPANEGREPERLARQVRPEAVRLLPPVLPPNPLPGDPSGARPARAAGAIGSGDMRMDGAAADPPRPDAASAATLAPVAGDATVCLETGPLGDAAASAAARALADAGVPAGGWIDARRELPGRWIVYMGRFPDRDLLQRKLDEVQRLDVSATVLRTPPELAPGIALGDFGVQADADARLQRLQARGVRTARVLQLPARGAEHRLRAERVDRAAAERLAGSNAERLGVRWQPCV